MNLVRAITSFWIDSEIYLKVFPLIRSSSTMFRCNFTVFVLLPKNFGNVSLRCWYTSANCSLLAPPSESVLLVFTYKITQKLKRFKKNWAQLTLEGTQRCRFNTNCWENRHQSMSVGNAYLVQHRRCVGEKCNVLGVARLHIQQWWQAKMRMLCLLKRTRIEVMPFDPQLLSNNHCLKMSDLPWRGSDSGHSIEKAACIGITSGSPPRLGWTIYGRTLPWLAAKRNKALCIRQLEIPVYFETTG